MSKLPLFIGFASAMLLGGAAYGQQSSSLHIQVKSTPATSGKQMYASYCATCHGMDGRGRGPAAAALKEPPADLTMLSKNNQGKFPAQHVASVLTFGRRIPAHGSADMPVWGPILTRLDAEHSKEAIRVSNLTSYIETLQTK